MEEYLTPKEVAAELGINYPCLIARIRNKKVKAIKRGWALFIHRDELKRIKDANNSDLESAAR
jgi:hypothetical protein